MSSMGERKSTERVPGKAIAQVAMEKGSNRFVRPKGGQVAVGRLQFTASSRQHWDDG
jgi:hypothetical protein